MERREFGRCSDAPIRLLRFRHDDWEATERFAMLRDIDQVGDRGISKGLFDGFRRIVKAAVQRAEVDAMQSQRALVETPDGVDRRHHFQNRQGARCAGQSEAALLTALGIN